MLNNPYIYIKAMNYLIDYIGDECPPVGYRSTACDEERCYECWRNAAIKKAEEN